MTDQRDENATLVPNQGKLRLQHLLPGFGLALLGTQLSATPVAIDASPTASAQTDAQPAGLPPELQAAGKWQAFKALWRALDAVPPAQSQAAAPPDGRQFVPVSDTPISGQWPTLPGYAQRAYYRALDAQEAARLHASLQSIFGDKITSPVGRMLYRLTQLRIQEMSIEQRVAGDHEVINETMCRAMPPTCITSRLAPVPPSLYMVYAIDRLEIRAKTLVALRDKGAIGDAAFASALDGLQQEARLALYLDAFAVPVERPSLRDVLPARVLLVPADFQSANNIDLRTIQPWERAAQAASVRLTAGGDRPSVERAQRLLEDLAALRAAWIGLAPLLAELER